MIMDVTIRGVDASVCPYHGPQLPYKDQKAISSMRKAMWSYVGQS